MPPFRTIRNPLFRRQLCLYRLFMKIQSMCLLLIGHSIHFCLFYSFLFPCSSFVMISNRFTCFFVFLLLLHVVLVLSCFTPLWRVPFHSFGPYIQRSLHQLLPVSSYALSIPYLSPLPATAAQNKPHTYTDHPQYV